MASINKGNLASSSPHIIDRFQPPNQLVTPSGGPISPQIVQKDDHKNENRSRSTETSINTHQGEKFVFNHGKLSYFEYAHVSSDLMTSVLLVGPGTTPSLAPDNDFTDDAAKLSAKYKRGAIPDTARLTSVKFKRVLALEYSEDPENNYTELVTIPEGEAVQSGVNITTEVKRLSTVVTPGVYPNQNSIALYFETPKYYHYIHVNSEVNPPELELQSVDKTPEFSPDKEFLRHLQFVENLLTSNEGDRDNFQLECIPEKEKTSTCKDRSQSNGFETAQTPKGPMLSDPNMLKSDETDQATTDHDSNST